jgi:hypothetical protein
VVTEIENDSNRQSKAFEISDKVRNSGILTCGNGEKDFVNIAMTANVINLAKGINRNVLDDDVLSREMNMSYDPAKGQWALK